MPAFAHNLRVAFRHLLKSPAFSLTIILTLAVGIGATTAIFSLVEGILLRPLPFHDPDRLVVMGDHLGGGPGIGVTAREIGTYAASTTAFSSLGGYTGSSYELSGGATPEQISAARLGASVFTTLGVQPILGRVFTRQEEDAHQPLAVISYALWQNRYHRDARILGASIDLDRRPYTIIGVMPRSFAFPLQPGQLDQAQLWVPLSLRPDELDPNSGLWGYTLVARLKPGVSFQQAAQDTDRVARDIMRNFPVGMASLHIQGDAKSLRDVAVEDARPLLRTLFFAVAIVLLIACVNAAGLLLVRAIRHRREYAVRLALGARSSVILRESVFEGLLLALTGGLVGVAFAAAAVRTALHLLPESMPRIDSISIDPGVISFALLLALATGVLCSLAPAFAALRTNLVESLKEGARTGTGASGHSWLRSVLVVSEIAVALVLLTVAGAFLRSFQKMRAVDPGFRPDHVLVAGFQLPIKQYATAEASEQFDQAVVDRLTDKPGVVAVGISNMLPGSGMWGGAAYTIEGVPTSAWKLQFVNFASAYGDYFHAMGIPLLEGRVFNENDTAGKPLVILINQAMALHCWPGQDPIGKRMHVGNPKKGFPWATVVGIVGNTKRGALDEPDTDQWYYPSQQPATFEGNDAPTTLSSPAGGYISLRSTLPPEQMTQTLRSTIAQIDPMLALQQVQPMEAVVSNIEAPRRFNTDLITAFAIGALLLAITGVYAVIAFSVSLRTEEIAIRMALGAQRTNIARLVLVSGARLAIVGCGLGVIASLAVSQLITSLLFNVSATDPFIYVAACLTMMLLALAASAIPAARAASADPVDTLRST